MQGVHEAMVSAMDSSLNRPRYPHMYERPVAPSCLVLFKDEIKIHGGSSSFQQRIQGIRQFAFMIEQMTSDADDTMSEASAVVPTAGHAQVAKGRGRGPPHTPGAPRWVQELGGDWTWR